MAKLNLRRDYLENEPDLLVTDCGKGQVSIQVEGYCNNPYRPALTAWEIATITAKILEENPIFELQCYTDTTDGFVLGLKNIIPEPVPI